MFDLILGKVLTNSIIFSCGRPDLHEEIDFTQYVHVSTILQVSY